MAAFIIERTGSVRFGSPGVIVAQSGLQSRFGPTVDITGGHLRSIDAAQNSLSRRHGLDSAQKNILCHTKRIGWLDLATQRVGL
jgi:hypothetical protein